MYKRRKLAIATIVYWFLLAYTIAALVFWFIELQTQNQRTTNYKLEELKHDDAAYIGKVERISLEKKKKTAQYIGEGVTFLLVISVSAVFLYRAVMRQIKVQQQQQNFMMAVTHELKTPIAVAKLNLETLQKYNLEEDKRQRMIRSSLQEIHRLDVLINNILVSAQLEGGRYRFSKDDLDFSSLVENAANDFMHRFPEQQWKINIMPGLRVNGDILLLRILVNNLIENAVKYSPAQGKLTIETGKENNRILLRVKDEGPGIPAEERKKIFRKFYRVGNEETRTTQGTGLGLYLCMKIVADHQGRISVSENVPAGSIFTVLI